jgi:D-alanyl-D-alanine-carboxypeptidase/D-alanyl-D-alanine-endopeptidase
MCANGMCERGIAAAAPIPLLQADVQQADVLQSDALQPAPALQQADRLAQRLFNASSSTGMVFVLVRDHQAFIHGYGETAPGSAIKPDERSLLRLCSLSKIFATDLLSKLVVDRTLQLDDPLQRFAPPHVIVPTRDRGVITLEDLATHTSGLPREVGNAPRGTPHFTFPDYPYRWHWLPTQHLKTAPGTAALYSNIGFDLLGDAFAQAAHTPYARLLATRTTEPLGMRETGFTPTAAQCARLLQGAHDEGACTDTQESAASAGVYSTADDMAIFLKYLLGDGSPAQSPAAQAVYVQPATLISVQGLDHAGTPAGIGLGWMHLLDDANPSAITEKTGGGAGFTTYIAINQHSHTALFVAFTQGAANNHVNVFKAANDLLLTVAGEPPMPPEPKHVAMKPATHRQTATKRQRAHAS